MKHYSAAGLFGLCLLSARAFAADPECGDWSAVLYAPEGTVWIRKTEESDWVVAHKGDEVCLGGFARTDDYSRAAFSLPGEAEVRVAPGSTAHFRESEDENRVWLELLRGIFHILERQPKNLKVTTPYYDAGLEGTELLVIVDDELKAVAVFEGRVRVANAAGGVDVDALERVVIVSGAAGAVEPNLQVRPDLEWAQHYPLIIAEALPEPEAEPASGDGAAFYVARAQRRVLTGRVDAARDDLQEAGRADPGNAEALALSAIIALGEDDIEQAKTLIDTALESHADSVAALLARTYVLSREDERIEALDVARAASRLAPANAVALGRLAETSLEAGAIREALDAARRAVGLDSELAAPHTVLGFVALKSGDLDTASAEFTEAARLDPAAALPHVGLAFVLYREGLRIDGRDELERAIALEANDSVLRSYMGRAYGDEDRDMTAALQIMRAEGLDSLDLTAPLYAAPLAMDANRPIVAVQNLREAQALSGNASPYRSGLYVDDDLITRSAGLGSMYRDSGFVRLGLRSAVRALGEDPRDFASHRLLADVASAFARSQETRINEAYKAQLLEPVQVQPTAPELAETNLFILDSAGPSTLATALPRSSFVENRAITQVSAIAAGQGTVGEHVVVSHTGDTVSINAGQYHYESDGFRPNNDITQDVQNLLLRFNRSATRSLQLELRSARTIKGDLLFRFAPDNYDPTLRNKDAMDSVRFGVMQRIGLRSTLLGSVMLAKAENIADSPLLGLRTPEDAGVAEIELLRDGHTWNLEAGFRAFRAHDDFSLVIPAAYAPPDGLSIRQRLPVRHLQTYVYVDRKLADSLLLTLGISLEHLDDSGPAASRSNPKLGLSWRPTASTEIHAAYFETLEGPAISRQLTYPSLEPMYVASFAQYLSDATGTTAINRAFGIDHDLGAHLSIGAERTMRIARVPVWQPLLPDAFSLYLHPHELTESAYLYWTPNPRLALKANWQFEDFDFQSGISPYGFLRLRTRRLPLETKLFLGDALSFDLVGTHISQWGLFHDVLAGPFADSTPDSDQFWVFDAAISYRLPSRRGTVDLGIRNLLDADFRFQDTDPENPHVFPERFVSVRFSLTF